MAPTTKTERKTGMGEIHKNGELLCRVEYALSYTYSDEKPTILRGEIVVNQADRVKADVLNGIQGDVVTLYKEDGQQLTIIVPRALGFPPIDGRYSVTKAAD